MNEKGKFVFRNDLSLIHSIRGFAAFYVVISHSKFVLWSGGREFLKQFPRNSWSILDYLNFGLTILFNSGTQMVMIFFVLSGFFISMSLDKRFNSFLSSLKYFYLVRTIRIYVPYVISAFFAVFVLVLVSKITPDLIEPNKIIREFNLRLVQAFQDLNLKSFFRSILFLPNQEYIGLNLVYWSLLYEGIFYLIVPFIQLIKKLYFLVSLLLFIVGSFFSFINFELGILGNYFLQYNFYFTIGMAIYFYKDQLYNFTLNKNLKKLILIISFISFIIFDFLKLKGFSFLPNFFAAVTGGSLLILLLFYKINGNRLVGVAEFLGKISYSLYLIHFPILILVYASLYYVTGKSVYFGFEFIIGVCLSLPAGWCLYRFAEEPSMSWIRSLKKKLKVF